MTKKIEFYTKEIEHTDEKQINNLYRIITGISRTKQQFDWQWIKTWYGKGSSWLLFDPSRKENETLICQYSLLPTPFSYYGKYILAGKTENCMSHPDFRGKKIYFPHEKKYFEEAKKRFDIFFTTTGQGAPGRVRRKLGYIALDYWVNYTFFINRKSIYKHLINEYLPKNKINSKKHKIVFLVLSYLYNFNKKLKNIRIKNHKNYTFKTFNSNNSPLSQIENFWSKNKQFYNITINRTAKYLAWRIDENPFLKYKYLNIYNGINELVGFIIYTNHQNKYIIEDIAVEKKDTTIFNLLLNQLILKAKKENINIIVCATLKENPILKDVFSKSKFIKIDFSTIKNLFAKKNTELRPFHSYIKPELDKKGKALKSENWYITAIVKEGKYV